MKNLWELHLSEYKGDPDKLRNLLFPSGLFCLTTLCLMDCKLQEGALLDSIHQLSSLTMLDLRYNDFITLPASIGQLSNLHYLYLDLCKNLKYLPELPSNVQYVYARGCPSLETWLCQAYPRHFASSSQWRGTSTELEIMRKYLQVPDHPQVPHLVSLSFCSKYKHKGYRLTHDRSLRIETIFMGSEIPNYCSYQSERSSISIELLAPCDTKTGLKLNALIACCVFGINGNGDDDPSRVFYRRRHYALRLKIDGNAFDLSITFEVERGVAVADHVWLIVIPLDVMYINADCRFGIHYKTKSPDLKVKKCGIHLVYDSDIAEADHFNQNFDNSVSIEANNQLIRKAPDIAETSASGGSHWEWKCQKN